MFQPTRSLLQCAATGAFCFVAGATFFAQAQTPEERLAIERAQSAFKRGDRDFGERDRQDALLSPDGNFAVFDLGQNNADRCHAVYDFAGKRVFFVTFNKAYGSVSVRSESLSR